MMLNQKYIRAAESGMSTRINHTLNCVRCICHFMFASFFTVVILIILVLLCLLIVEDIVQDTTFQLKGSWMLLNSIHLYIYKKDTFRMIS